MSVKPGWYDDPQGRGMRWWDGAAWTDHVRQAAPPPPPPAAPPAAPPPPTTPISGDTPRQDLGALQDEYEALKSLVVETREVMLLQEVGLYEYSHPLDSSAHFKDALKELQAEMKSAIKAGHAVAGTDRWAINGSQKEGAKMVSDFCKLLLRAYNTEADNLVRSMKPYGKDAAVKRLEKLRTSISKLAATMKIEVSDQYHDMKVRELELTSDYKAKLAEEKEHEREERARLREEAAAQKEFERAQAKLEKERAHYQTALEALRAKGDGSAAADAEAKLEEIAAALQGVIDRAANIRAGYVYVISNIGAFGDRVVKIGMTRRLEPMDRVRELGDASVPYRFDVHCIVFSDDAVGLESALHRKFAERRLNHVNLRREFFFVTPLEVRDALEDLRGELLSFTETPEALEWHQSEHIRQSGPQT